MTSISAKLVSSCTIIVDGGCKGNGTEQAKSYGSYAVYVNGEKVRTEHFDLPDAKTNNQAEFQSLTKALVYIEDEPKRAHLPWTVQMDSNLVVMMVTDKWQGKDELLKSYACQIKQWLNDHSVTVEKVTRTLVVAALGH